MHNFKVGDLALIVGSVNFPETIGRAVELVEFLGAGRVIHLDNGRWIDNVDLNRMWSVRLLDGKYTDKFGGVRDDGPCREQFLMPLRGDFAPERQKSQEQPA